MAKNSTLKSAQKAYKKGQKARANAKKKGVVTSQRPEQKKKVQPKPKTKTPTTTTQKTSPKPSVSTPSKPRTLTPKLPTTNVTQQYDSYKKSTYAPKVTNTSKNSSLTSAQKAFDKSQKAQEKAKKKGVVGTTANKPKDNVITDLTTPKNYDYKKDLQKGYKKGSETTYLGTKQEDVTVDLATKKQRKKQTEAQQKQFYKSDDWEETKSQLKQANQKQWRDYLRKELGWSKDQINEWMESEEGKQYRKDTYTEMKDSVKTDINKSIKEGVDKATTLKSVDALTRGEFDKMVTASALGKDLGNKYLKSVGGKKLKEKIGSKTIEAGLRSEGAYGVMQGMSKADIFSGSVGSYNEGARTGMQQIKDSGAYNVGYGIGMGADMLMGGVASSGVSLAEGTGTLASKLLGKGVSKKVATEAVEEYAKLSKSGLVKTFAKNRTGELLAETPTNILDAVKMSLDADGNLNKDEFKKWMLINSGLTVGIGGAMEGIGAGLSKRLSNKTVELLGKKEAGVITKEESEQLDEYINKLTRKAEGNPSISSKIADDTLVESRRVDNQLQYMQAGKGTGTPNTPNATKGEGTFYTRGGRQTVKEASDANQARLAKAREEATIRENARKPEKATTPEQIEARKEVAEKHGRNVADPTETARLNEVRRLQENVRRLRSELDDAEKRVKNDNTMGGHAKAVAERDEIKKALEIREKQLARANSETLSGRYSKALDNVKKDNTLQGHTKASKDLEKVEAELKADSERKIRKKKLQNAVKKAEEMVEKNPSPENKARLEVAKEALEKSKSKGGSPKRSVKEIDEEMDRVRENLEALRENGRGASVSAQRLQRKLEALGMERGSALKTERGGVPKVEAEAKASEPPSTPKEYAKEQSDYNNARGRLEASEKEFKELDIRGAKLWKEIKEGGYTPEEHQNLLKEHASIQRKKKALEKEIHDLRVDFNTAEDRLKKAKEKVEPRHEYATSQSIIDELEEMGIKNDSEVNATLKESAEGLGGEGEKLAPQKTAPSGRISEEGMVDATTQKKSINKIFTEVRSALVDNFDALEYIANRLPDGKRKEMLTQINELRRAIKTGRAIVAEKGRKIYANAGLTKRGKEVALKREDFERYCFLKHELARRKVDKSFMTDLTDEQLEKEISDLERKYATNVDKKTGEILHGEELEFKELETFQKDMVQYFDDLLTREVDAGITSKAEAELFRKTFPDYVPTYREKDFKEILKRHTKDEIDVGRAIKSAKGGSDDPLIPLYNQMQAKTNIVLKRTELNKTLNLLCTASGVTTKELDELVPLFRQMPDEQKPQALLDTQVFTHEKDGKYNAVMYRNGSRIEIQIDQDVYDAIRRWSGEDRKTLTVTMLSFMVDNKALNVASSWFKKWITDYNLIFGLKNLKRDLATAVFYTTDKKGYIKNLPKALGVCMLPDSIGRKLMPNWDAYKKAYNAYKENGGIISQFVSRDSASPTFFDSMNKANPLKWIENFNSAMETIPRMAEFLSAFDKRALEVAGKDGDYAKAFSEVIDNQGNVADAMYRAKDVTLNFDRSGWFGAKLNRGLVPFFNPAMQGLDKLYRVMVRDNIKYGENGLKLLKADNPKEFFKDTTVGAFLKMGVYTGGLVALPSVLWNSFEKDGHSFQDYINGEVDGYEKQSDYNRYANWLLPIGDGKFIKIPKARELASMQALLDFYMDNMKYGSGSKWEKLFGEESFRDFMSMKDIAVEQIGPVSPFSDNLISPLWRTWQNKTWYDGAIENASTDAQHREEGERWKIWDENTSAFAKAIGKQFNVSPKKVDNLLDSYTGFVYDYFIKETNAKNDVIGRFKQEGIESGVGKLLSSPWGSAFVVDSVFQNAHKSDYYIRAKEKEAELDKLEEGSPEYTKLKAEITKDQNAFSYTSSQYDELMAKIYLDKNLTPSEKNKYVRLLKKGDNLNWSGREHGKKTSQRDPMADAWNLTDKNGKRVLSTDKIIDACSYTFSNGTNTIKDAWKAYKKNGGKSAEKFIKVTLGAREVNMYAGDSLTSPRWETIAYSSTLNNIKGTDKIMASYIEKESTRKRLLDNASIYKAFGGTLKNYKVMSRTTTQGAYDLGYSYASEVPDGVLTMIIANARTKKGGKYRDLSYQANDFYILNRMNGARCLDTKKNGGYTAKDVKDLCEKYNLEHDSDYKWNVEKVKNAINKEYPDAPDEVKASYFNVITGYTYSNPFGSIGDYSLDNDTGVYCSGGGGYGRRGRRRRGHGGGGGGGKSAFTPVVNTAGKGAKVTNTSKKSHTSKSNLDDAYRKRLKKLREATRK